MTALEADAVVRLEQAIVVGEGVRRYVGRRSAELVEREAVTVVARFAQRFLQRNLKAGPNPVGQVGYPLHDRERRLPRSRPASREIEPPDHKGDRRNLRNFLDDNNRIGRRSAARYRDETKTAEFVTEGIGAGRKFHG